MQGVNSKHGDRVSCLLENAPRLWDEMHEKYHAKAAEIGEARKKGATVDWYDELAARCKALGLTKKEDVLSEVIKYYVEDSKKGFDQFAVQRAFHAVFARVNGEECKSYLYSACAERLFRW